MAALFQIRRGDSGSLDVGELFYNTTSQSLQLGSDSSSVITLAKINEVNSGSFNISGDLFVSGNTNIVGNLTFGDNSGLDTVTVVASLSSSLIPQENNSFDLGSTTKYWKTGYITALTGSLSGSVNGIDLTPFSTSIDSRLDYLEGTFSTSVDSRMDLLENAMSGSKRLYVSPEGNDTNDGTQHNPFKTIKAAVESLYPIEPSNPLSSRRYTIFVGSGEYTEQNPIVVPPGVSIVGDTLRTVRLTAANPTKDFFHVHDSNYFYGLRFLDLKHPAFAFAFPSSTATSTISGGSISTISVIHSVSGYTDGNNQDLGIIIEGPDASGSIATATANVVGGVITQINVVSGGTNYTTIEKPHISIPAPLAKRPLITTSPYIQNCSSITGPFNTSGVKVQQALPYSETAFNIDEQGAGGGLRIDGNLVHPLSPLESFVADAFTQVNQGGPGHLVINKGYAQFVSCFTTFCTYGFKVANGGFANISNSVIDFGKKGLVSKTYYPQTYNTAVANESKYSSVTGFEITQDGAGYTGSLAGVTLSAPDIIGGTQATAEAVVSILGTITSVYITNAGTGYTSEPIVTIATPNGPGAVQATANSIISGVTQMRMVLADTTQSVEISSNMILDGQNYLVTNVATGSTISEKLITTFPNPPQIESGNNVYFHKLSNISTGGLVMEYAGSGVTYNALPKFGGVPDRTKEIVEIAPGRIFYSTVDNIGNLKIGEYFAVDQLTGEVTIDARNFNLSGINQIGPFRRNGLSVGQVLREVSDSVTLVNSQGVVGSDTVPTQYAVYEYVNNYTSSADTRFGKVETTASNHETRVDILEVSQSAFDTAVVLDSTNVTILGNLTIQGTQTSIQSTILNVVDKNITLASGSIDSATANGAGINIDGADVTMSWNHTNQRIELNKDFAVTGLISSSTIVGIGNVTLYSTSVNSRLDGLELTSSNFDGRLDSIETFTSSFTTISQSIDNRLDTVEAFSSSIKTEVSNSVSGNVNQIAYFDEIHSVTQFVHSFIGAATFGLGTNAVSSEAERLMVDNGQSYNIATFQTSRQNSYAEVNIKNFGSGSNASADLVIWNDVATDSSSYLDLGINSSNYTGNEVGYAGDGYLYNSNNDLYVGSTAETTHGHTHIFGGNLWQSSSINVYSDGTVGINTDKYDNDASTIPHSTQGFAVEVSGSVIFSNNINVSGSVSASTLVGIGNITTFSTSVDTRLDGLENFSASQYKTDSASFASDIAYLQTIAGVIESGSPVLEYETVGTLGNLLIKGATSKSIQVVDSITFTGLSTGGNQYTATGLLMTGSITASNGFSGSINGIGNVSEFSASIDSRIVNNQPIGYVTTASFEAYTSSTNSRVNAIESFTSSIDTTIKTKLNLDNVISGSTQITALLPAGVVSGSIQVNIYEVENFAVVNDAIAFDISQKLFTSSFNEYTQSTNTRLNSLEIKTGSYATTGSNIFFGTQTFTGSVYITQDLIVQGSSSLQNVTASAVSIGTNQINLNTDFPAFRYAGLNVYDSGSSGVSASLQWDSLNDQWIFLHQESGSVTVDSSILLYGPLSNDGLGSEATLTGNFLTKVENNGHGHHLTTSSIQDTGTLVTINSATQITGSLGVNSTQTLQSFTILSNVGQNLNFANDAAAAIGGVPLYGLYRNGNFIMIRLT
jgi:hypothetical protein